jgi:hypothetical protein
MSDRKKKSEMKSTREPGLETLEIGSVSYNTRLTAKFRNRVLWRKPNKRSVEAVIPGTIHRS